ncbi:MAG TPA: exosortase/archaeosortase family protein [Pyrinomonadaceae bacterium]|nr:exosortase/archaeosortase family protein [Pyrinomonadaceae bacterium]
MTALAPAQLWKPFAVAAAVLFVYATVLTKLGNQWWIDENYSHGLLMPFIIGYILWSERERLASAPRRPKLLLGGALVALAVLMLWAGTAGAELFMQRTSLVVMLAGITIYFWGWRILRLALVPLLLLALAIPIPAIIFNQIAFPLQLFASRCAVWAMRAFDIPVLRQGNIIELMPLNSSVTKKLEVVEACSGIRSLMTLLTLAVVFAYFTHPRDPDQQGGSLLARLKRYGTWRSLILVVSAVPIAIITNAARVSGTGILARYYGTEVADGFFHEFSGWVVYIAAFLLLFALGWVLDKFGARKPPQNKPPRKTAQTTDATAKDETTETPAVATPATISFVRERGADGS